MYMHEFMYNMTAFLCLQGFFDTSPCGGQGVFFSFQAAEIQVGWNESSLDVVAQGICEHNCLSAWQENPWKLKIWKL